MCARRRSATPEDDTQRHAFTVSFDDDHHLVSGLLVPKSVGVGVDVGDLYSIEPDDDIATPETAHVRRAPLAYPCDAPSTVS